MAEIETDGEHLDPTAEITLETVKKRAVKGIAVPFNFFPGSFSIRGFLYC
ncbi:MAG: hypothetical protein P8Y06_02330 [Patescibacteria group bacterium]